jgi:hypothetical protein
MEQLKKFVNLRSTLLMEEPFSSLSKPLEISVGQDFALCLSGGCRSIPH